MPSRHELNAIARALGFDPATIPNDSKLEQKVKWLLKRSAASTGTAAASTLTSNNTNVSDGDTVTIGGTTYTFKTALTGAANQVLIGADADGSLTNLRSAVNGTGTAGTDYTSATKRPNPDVSVGAVSSHAVVVTSRDTNTGNDLATTKSAATLSWTGATLGAQTAGVPGVVAAAGAGVKDTNAGIAGDANTSV